ncbi:MAG: amino acid ABC transporter permease [Actinobacteria bacterium]|nr:amino acid ABC transporter permease [Actinomycetota bacterium]
MTEEPLTGRRPSPIPPPGRGAEVEQQPRVPSRHPWRWLAVLVLVIVFASLIHSAVTNSRFEWEVIWGYVFDSRILAGLRTTLILTAVSMALAFIIGLGLATMRLSENPVLRWLASLYIWAFRGTPILLQLLIWYNLAALYPVITLGVPFGPAAFEWNANSLITPWVAAILGLALNEAAYLAEIIRGGIISVDRGQTEAAKALGMNGPLAFRRVVLPQALRVIVPPLSNETIGLLKYSSIVSVITLPELLYSGQLIYARTYQTIPVLIAVSIWYLVVTSVLTVIEHLVERRLATGWAEARAHEEGLDGSKEGRWPGWLSFNR